MKTLVSYCLLILLVGLQCCDLFNKDDPKTELEKLPLATQEGKGTWGCLINGRAWYETQTFSDYQMGLLSISAKQKIFEPVLQGMGLTLREDNTNPPLEVGVYNLHPNSPYYPWVTYHFESCYYGFSSNNRIDTQSGSLTITKFDKTKFIIAGLFEFTTVHAGCDTIKVTEGRFDMKYAP